MSFSVAGVSFYRSVVDHVKLGDYLDMKAEPDNKYDKNAIAILKNGETCGYVPKQLNTIFKRNLNSYKLKVIEKRVWDGPTGLEVMLEQ